MVYLTEGKTDKEWLTLFSQSILCHGIRHHGFSFPDNKELLYYFDNGGNLISPNTVGTIKELEEEYGKLSDLLKERLNINDGWEDNVISVDENSLLQLLTLALDQEGILRVVKKLINLI